MYVYMYASICMCVCVCIYTSLRSAGRKHKHMAGSISTSQLPSNIKANVCCTAWLKQ